MIEEEFLSRSLFAVNSEHGGSLHRELYVVLLFCFVLLAVNSELGGS